MAILFLDGDQVDRMEDAKPLIPGILAQGEVTLLYGPKGCAKSFEALDWDLCVANDVAWEGRPIKAPGIAVHVATEGASGYKQRKRAWERHRQQKTPRARFHLVGRPVQLLDEREVGEFIAGLRTLAQQHDTAVRLVTFDTFSQCITDGATGDSGENGNTLMNKAVAAARRIAEATGATVVLVHHEGPNGLPRGGKALLAGCDRVLHLHVDGRRKGEEAHGVQPGEAVRLHYKWSRDDSGAGDIMRIVTQVEDANSLVLVGGAEAATAKQDSTAPRRKRTPRKPSKQLEILRLYGLGKKPADIARTLRVSPGTVRSTISRSKTAPLQEGAA